MREYILKDRKPSIISKILIIIIWILLSKFIDNEIILPTIKSTFVNFIQIIKNPNFITIISYSVLRSLIGFIISLFLAIIIGIFSSISKTIYYLMIPIINFLSSVPTMAIIILAIIWLNNELVPIFVGFIMVFPILYETVLKGILNIDKDIIAMAQIYKADKLTIIKDIYIPSIFINLSNVFSSTLGINLKMVIAGEVLSQPKYAIGSNLQLQKMYLNTSGIFAWIIIILFIAKVFEYILERVEILCIKSRI
ncbi:NitT/TauT family transport system permease protein [Tissierella praeacuta DSM 18095]|uniref:NitT/TauT family transport system permease protein n=1 Tax=Tissierella praeacuta DSM 18095 TaxID=1123404 RepID=A0A1M4YCE7_9FIRM|nr:ABC transporter permease subunit [Tissierella praeacuta]SHF03369.1 NitT/TauT family transport system permease protein [Tissierella praeacuta DSM 18095]SUP03194.1 Putative aliphatic sulfonates transport permease protein ssuC [Tissierella praeacuta]